MPTHSVTVYRPTFLVPLGILFFVVSFCSFCGSCLVSSVPTQTKTESPPNIPSTTQAEDRPKPPIRKTTPEQSSYNTCSDSPPMKLNPVLNSSVSYTINLVSDCWSGAVELSPPSEEYEITVVPYDYKTNAVNNKALYYAHCSDGKITNALERNSWSEKRGCPLPVSFRAHKSKFFLKLEVTKQEIN
jgi:hypothetical protein